LQRIKAGSGVHVEVIHGSVSTYHRKQRATVRKPTFRGIRPYSAQFVCD
jgi:hypothetical protein